MRHPSSARANPFSNAIAPPKVGKFPQKKIPKKNSGETGLGGKISRDNSGLLRTRATQPSEETFAFRGSPEKQKLSPSGFGPPEAGSIRAE
jgi:hypothetical protein